MLNKKLTTLLMVIALLSLTVTSAFAAAPPNQDQMDIVDTAVADGRFTTLVTAVQAAGLVDTLKSDGPFTVFAPTDDAFAALPAGALDGLLADPEALANVLLYHVVPGKVMAADVVSLTSADSALGEPIAISIVDGNVVLNDSATVIITDIETSNGVIHVIDAVILPPSMTAAAEAAPAQLPATGGETAAGTNSVIAILALGLLFLSFGAALRFSAQKAQ
jgi:uncharacterized surface protein with fasciclin (FAS1) repeats